MYLLLISTFLFCEAALSAEIVNLNQTNIEKFVKNKYAVAFFCDFDHQRKECNKSTTEFLKAADILTNENIFTIAFGKMDHIKNKWNNVQVNTIDKFSFIFFHYGRYDKFWVSDAETIVSIVKRFKKYADGDPDYFHWEYKDRKEGALIIDLNKKNMKEFAYKNNAFAFFCDFDHYPNICEKKRDEFLTVADTLTEEKIPINFGIMDHTKNKWYEEKNFKINDRGDFLFFCSGRYDPLRECSVQSVKNSKNKCDKGILYDFFKYNEKTIKFTVG